MVLSTTKRTASIASLVNSNQGGGSKKMGLYPKVGLDSWTNLAYGKVPGRCLTLTCTRYKVGDKFACASRPVGVPSRMTYFKC
jgi:hypothetical protein